MKGLINRNAVVTGAASGIGAAIAKRFCDEGVNVLAIDRNAVSWADSYENVRSVQLDLTNGSTPGLVLENINSFLKGSCDILVNAAGVSAMAPFEETNAEVWDTTLAINFEAVTVLTRTLLPLLKKSDQARVIMIGSICSEFAPAGMSAYVVSKHAVLGLTRALASEFGGDGITVNCIQPGAIVTGITAAGFEGNSPFREHWENKAAIGRLGQPDDVAPLAAFLVSEEGRFISGHGIYVDGGAMQQG
ncbi:MAG: SDR family NAD(P)-dependent oxidoreductase [Porticoccaceae bacterium]|nr:SDR family NAD(P)-dependent oxidoreductase [Porticoccaceae bacterium]